MPESKTESADRFDRLADAIERAPKVFGMAPSYRWPAERIAFYRQIATLIREGES